MEKVSLFNYVVTVLQFTVMYCAFDIMLERRCRLWVIAVADFAAINVMFFVLLLAFPQSLSFARVPLGFVILALPLLLYSDKWYHRLLAFGAAQGILMISELITALFDRYSILIFTGSIESIPLTQRIWQYAFYIFVYTVLMLLLCVLVLRHRREHVGTPNAFEITVGALFFFCQCILLLGWGTLASYSTTLQQSTAITVALLLFLVSDMSVFALMRAVTNRRVLLAKNESIRRQMAAQSKYYDMFMSQSDAIRRMRHDIANHLFTIDAMLSNGDSDEAKRYSHELRSDGLCKPSTGLCLNSAADAFLSARFAQLEAEGIRVDASIALPAEPGISDVELISALGNLLDNAEEALRGAEEKYVAINARMQGVYLVIEASNPCTQTPGTRSAARRIPELERGVGFRIMSRLAEKHDGQFKYEIKDGLFQALLIMKTEVGNA